MFAANLGTGYVEMCVVDVGTDEIGYVVVFVFDLGSEYMTVDVETGELEIPVAHFVEYAEMIVHSGYYVYVSVRLSIVYSMRGHCHVSYYRTYLVYILVFDRVVFWFPTDGF